MKGSESGRYKNLTECRILKSSEDGVVLDTPNNNVFLYHLHLLQILQDAMKNQLYTYHFSLLRQLLQNVSSFLGDPRLGRLLSKLELDNIEALLEVINTHSHKTPYYYQTEMMSVNEEDDFKKVFTKLIEMYHFKF